MKFDYKIIVFSITFGLIIWMFDAALDSMLFYDTSFQSLAFFDVPQLEIYIRSLILLLFTVFGIIVSHIITKRRQAEIMLQIAYDELDIKVRERTADLARVNKELKEEVIERMRVEEQLLVSRQDWIDIFDTITDSITIHDDNFNIIKANRSAINFLKLPCLQSACDMKCYKYYHGTDAPLTGCPSCNCLRTREPGNSEFFEPFLQKYLEISAIPRFDKNHRLTGLIHIVRDITERKLAEETLRERDEQLSTIVETANEGIVSVNCRGEIVFWNQAAKYIFGFTVEEKLGTPLVSIMPEKFHSSIKRGINELVSTGKLGLVGKRIEMIGLKKDGSEIPFELSVSARKKGDEIFLIGIVRDITDRKKAAEEREQLKTRLAQAHKMEAIGTLAGGIAHDFNNILSPIIGYTEMIMEKLPKEDVLQDYAQRVLSASFRAKDLVRQILTFSRRHETKCEPVSVQLVIDEAMKLLRSTLPSTIELIQDIDEYCRPVFSDPTQIHQVIMNLCTNAYHAMEKTGGRLEIKLSEVNITYEETPQLDIFPGAYIMLSVKDDGPGMDKAIVDRIFDPYFTTKKEGKGTGLGLAVVHGIVMNYEGAIQVKSEPGMGTEFVIHLPVSEVDMSYTEENDSSVPYKRGNEHILLLDDEKMVLELEKLMLEDLGYHITAFSSSVKGFEVFCASPHAFDLVLTDYTMPHMTGEELALKIMEIRPDIPVVLCTGFSERINEKKAQTMGLKGYIMKPMVKRQIANVIREALDK